MNGTRLYSRYVCNSILPPPSNQRLEPSVNHCHAYIASYRSGIRCRYDESHSISILKGCGPLGTLKSAGASITEEFPNTKKRLQLCLVRLCPLSVCEILKQPRRLLVRWSWAERKSCYTWDIGKVAKSLSVLLVVWAGSPKMTLTGVVVLIGAGFFVDSFHVMLLWIRKSGSWNVSMICRTMFWSTNRRHQHPDYNST